MPSSLTVQVRLSPFVYELLKNQAEYESRSVSNMAAFLLETELRGDFLLADIRDSRIGI